MGVIPLKKVSQDLEHFEYQQLVITYQQHPM